jgi:metal-responsive CopG/Arc/MetJ family transcriptional regulator
MEERPISFRERAEIVAEIDRIANERGTNRSALIREFIRTELKRLKAKDK